MTVSQETLALVWNLVTQTGDVDDQNKPVPRTTFQAKHQKAKNSLRKKLIGLTEVATAPKDKPKETLVNADLNWEPNRPDFKPAEDRAVVADRFVAGELDLTDKEKEFVKFCALDREEMPDLSDEIIDGFRELTGVALGE